MVTSTIFLQQELTAEQPLPGQAVLLFSATITQQQLTAEQPMPGQAVLLFCSCHYSTTAHSRAAYARPGGAAFLQLPLLNSSSQQSSLCQARRCCFLQLPLLNSSSQQSSLCQASRCCFIAAAITQQQLTAEQPMPGQAVLLFCSYHFSIAALSRAASAKLGGAVFCSCN
jgi:hypothetical protein